MIKPFLKIWFIKYRPHLWNIFFIIPISLTSGICGFHKSEPWVIYPVLVIFPIERQASLFASYWPYCLEDILRVAYSVRHSFQTLVSMVKKEDVGIVYLLPPCAHTIICVCFLCYYCEHHTVLLQYHCISTILCALSGSKARTKSPLMPQKPTAFLLVCFSSCPWKH